MSTFGSEFDAILRAQMQPNKYPKWEFGKNLSQRDYEQDVGNYIDRIQVQVELTRFAFIMRHDTRHHWCGYVLCPEEDWLKFGKLIVKYSPVPIDFAMPAFDPICWMTLNTNGKLKQPAEVTTRDFWVGFDMTVAGPDNRANAMNHDMALGILYAVENLVFRIRHGHITT